MARRAVHRSDAIIAPLTLRKQSRALRILPLPLRIDYECRINCQHLRKVRDKLNFAVDVVDCRLTRFKLRRVLTLPRACAPRFRLL